MIANSPLQVSGCQATRDDRLLFSSSRPWWELSSHVGITPLLVYRLGQLRHGNVVRSALTGIYEWKSIR